MITTQDKKKNYTQIILIQEVLEQRQFLIKARIFWNQLPQNIKDEKSLKVFKRKLKAHLLSTY